MHVVRRVCSIGINGRRGRIRGQQPVRRVSCIATVVVNEVRKGFELWLLCTCNKLILATARQLNIILLYRALRFDTHLVPACSVFSIANNEFPLVLVLEESF